MDAERTFWIAIRRALMLAAKDIPGNNLRRAAAMVISAIEDRFGLTPRL